MVILNSECTSSSAELIELVWNRCDVISCADGGANRLHTILGHKPMYTPSSIIGDLDSVSPDVLDFYTQRGVQVVRDDDQDYNDLDKSLKYIASTYQAEAVKRTVIIIGGFGGRFDQEMASIHAMFKW